MKPYAPTIDRPPTQLATASPSIVRPWHGPVLGILALALVAACFWKLNFGPRQTYLDQVEAARIKRPVPLFEGIDQDNAFFRLARYAGRHRVLLLFVDPPTIEDRQSLLAQLVTEVPAFLAAGGQLVVISTARPVEHRAWQQRWRLDKATFVSDLDGRICRQFGRWREPPEAPRTGAVFVDRAGQIVHDPATGFPAAIEDPQTVIRLLKDVR